SLCIFCLLYASLYSFAYFNMSSSQYPKLGKFLAKALAASSYDGYTPSFKDFHSLPYKEKTGENPTLHFVINGRIAIAIPLIATIFCFPAGKQKDHASSSYK